MKLIKQKHILSGAESHDTLTTYNLHVSEINVSLSVHLHADGGEEEVIHLIKYINIIY